MNSTDFENSINDIEKESAKLVLEQQVYLDHLVGHGINSDPKRAEFLILFVALLESKIKNKIKTDLNSNCIHYFLEFPTLIARSNPHKLFENEDPFLKDDSELDDPHGAILESISSKISESSLGEFISNCFTYNSHRSIFKMLNDFALVENYYGIHKWSGFDLVNRRVGNFIKLRNNLIHNILDRKLSDKEIEAEFEEFKFIKKYLKEILEQIVLMVPAALKVRRTSIDGIKSYEDKAEINAQLDWLKIILDDYEKKYSRKNNDDYRIYSTWFGDNHGGFGLKHAAERLKKKLEEGSNV